MIEAKIPRSEEGAVADVERVVDRLLSRSLDRAGVIMEIDVPELRRALGRASQEDLDGVMRLAVGQVTASGAEMLVRSLLALRAACEEHDRHEAPSGQEYPRVAAEAERVERVVRFLVEIFGDYAKALRLAKLARQEDAKGSGSKTGLKRIVKKTVAKKKTPRRPKAARMKQVKKK